MATEKQREFYQSLRDQGAVQAYSNVEDWLRRLAIEEVFLRIAAKRREHQDRLPPPLDISQLKEWKP